MPSTFSPSLRLELIGNGEQAGNWGNTTNVNIGTLLEQAITGVATITMTGNKTLVAGNGVVDESRNAVLVLGGSLLAAANLVVPAVEKLYVVQNSTAGGFAVTVKTSGGTGISLVNGATQFMFCDGTNVYAASAPFGAGGGGGLIPGSVLFSGPGGVAEEDNLNFFWDNVNNRLGIGTNTPAGNLSVVGTASISSLLALGDGTVSAPSLTNIDDLNTGIFFPAPDTVAITTNGIEGARLDSAGNMSVRGNLTVSGTVSGANTTGVPTGTILEFGGASAPAGWLACDGSPVSRVTYSALFAVLGTAYGSGDGVNTFNVPDRRGRVSLGANATYLRGSIGGATSSSTSSAGSHSHTGSSGATALTTAQMPAHTHTGTTEGAGAHNHELAKSVLANNDPTSGVPGYFGGDYYGPIGTVTITNAVGNHTHTFTTSSVGSGATHLHSISVDGTHTHTVSTIPPYLASTFIIKT